ncbi:MAG: nitrilase-related carbon-nitrogen hydrolase, partial [Tepidisphaeraceae bacterium]
YNILVQLGPSYYESYVLTPGKADTLPAFSVGDYRFVTPICFEDLVGSLVARMVRDGSGGKRADFVVNLTNDGWFSGFEMPQHLQAAVFRSIENRVPTARSVNTGVSGFIDSIGHPHDLVAAGQEGWSVATLMVDRRVTVYTRVGEAFSGLCVLATAAMIAVQVRQMRMARKRP